MTPPNAELLRSLGVIGGVGPLASAEFLKTIYEQCKDVREQQMPKIFMYSDPSFPERSESWDSDAALLTRLQKGLHSLGLLDVSDVVVCCVTMHHLLPELAADQRKKIISLVDIIFKKLAESPAPHVVLCSTRTSRVGLFQRHPGGSTVSRFLILPDEEDQRQVHDLIFYLKHNGAPNSAQALLDRFAEKYGTRRFICGCTEMHLLAKWFHPASGVEPRYTFLDPLMIVAQSLARNDA